MKGFPNQIADLRKLSQGMQCVLELVDQGANPRDDGVLGEALIRASVLRPGRTPISIESYLQQQQEKSRDRQSFRTSARGLRELYRFLGLIADSEGALVVTPEGREAAAFGDAPLGPRQIEFWRRVILNFRLGDDERASHPYQVLLHLIARKPGITRAKCALALEAKDDSPEELQRIVELAGLTEDRIRARVGVSQSNWDNAKKIIPSFAEQLGDVVKTGETYRLADAPGRASEDGGLISGGAGHRDETTPRRPRTSRSVTPETIGMAGIAERDEPPIPPTRDPEAAAEGNRLRADRLRRHNVLLRELATRLYRAGMTLNELSFDVFAVLGRVGILGEIKTLDGTEADERDRVRDALAQLLYYEAFVIPPVEGGVAIHKIACFERRISVEHQRWLNQSGIATIWKSGDHFEGDALAAGILGRYLEELR